MKLKNITNHKLIKLELLKSNFMNKQTNKLKPNLFNLIASIKKILLIIYKYNLTNKKIFFFGVPKNLYIKHKRVLKNSKHLFFPKSYWEKGLLSNKINIFKYLKKKVNSINSKHKKLNTKITSYFLIKKKPDLIVILNENNENISLVAEANKLKIPVVNFNKTQPIFLNNRGSNPNMRRKQETLYFSLIYSILKKNKI